MACPASSLDVPLHSNLGILAQCRRRLLRQAHKPTPQARHVHLHHPPQGRHPPLHRRGQLTSQTLHVDRRSQTRARRCQTREASVRVSPLVRPCSSSSPPLSLASRPRTRVFHLEPVGRAAGAVGRILPLRHDTFKPHLAGMGEDGLAITQRRHTTVYQLKPHFPPSLLPSWSN